MKVCNLWERFLNKMLVSDGTAIRRHYKAAHAVVMEFIGESSSNSAREGRSAGQSSGPPLTASAGPQPGSDALPEPSPAVPALQHVNQVHGSKPHPEVAAYGRLP